MQLSDAGRDHDGEGREGPPVVAGVLSNGEELLRALQDGGQSLQGAGTRLKCQGGSHRLAGSREPNPLLPMCVFNFQSF